jgi:hypothetical protein
MPRGLGFATAATSAAILLHCGRRRCCTAERQPSVGQRDYCLSVTCRDYTGSCVAAGTSARYLWQVPTGGKFMLRTFMIAAATAAVLTLSPTVFGQQSDHGTAEQAKAILVKAEAAVKANKSKALEMFNAGEGGFVDRDLYVFCANISDGKIVATGNTNAKQVLGQDLRTLEDSTGKVFGSDLYAAGKKPDGQITKVSYLFVRPGPDTKPVPKVSLVTRVSDLVCGVGYYK